MHCPTNPCFSVTNVSTHQVFVSDVCIPPNATILLRRLPESVQQAVSRGFLTVTACGGPGQPDCLALLSNREYFSGPEAPDPNVHTMWYSTVHKKLFVFSAGAWVSDPGVPIGGLTGQVLMKTSDEDFLVTWASPDVTWNNITGKPTTFPVEPHTHLSAHITDLNQVLQDFSTNPLNWSSTAW